MTGLEVAIPYIMAATAAVGAVGAIQSGQAAKQAGDYNRAVMQINASQTRAETGENVRRMRRMNSKAAGKLTNQLVSDDVLSDQVSEMELEALTAQYQGNVKAMRMESQGAFSAYRGAQQQSQSRTTAATTLMSGTASAGAAGYELGVFS